MVVRRVINPNRFSYVALALAFILGCDRQPNTTHTLTPQQSIRSPNGLGSFPQIPITDILPEPSADEMLNSWLAVRNADVSIQRVFDSATHEPNDKIVIGNATGDLGETPPIYRHRLQTAQRPILIGEKDTRHRFER